MPARGPAEPLVQLTCYRYGLVLKQWLDPTRLSNTPIARTTSAPGSWSKRSSSLKPTRLTTGLR